MIKPEILHGFQESAHYVYEFWVVRGKVLECLITPKSTLAGEKLSQQRCDEVLTHEKNTPLFQATLQQENNIRRKL